MVTLASDAIKWGDWESEISTWKTEKLKSQPGAVAQASIPSTREAERSGSLEFSDSQDSIIKRPCLWGGGGKKEIKGGDNL